MKEVMGGLDDKAHDLLPMLFGLNTANPGLLRPGFFVLILSFVSREHQHDVAVVYDFDVLICPTLFFHLIDLIGYPHLRHLG